MSCQEYQEQLTLYLLGDLEAGQAAQVRAHLETCAACRAAAGELERTLDLMRSAFAVSPAAPAQLDAARRRKILRAKFRWWPRPWQDLAKVAAVLLLSAGLLSTLLMPGVQRASRKFMLTSKLGDDRDSRWAAAARQSAAEPGNAPSGGNHWGSGAEGDEKATAQDSGGIRFGLDLKPTKKTYLRSPEVSSKPTGVLKGDRDAEKRERANEEKAALNDTGVSGGGILLANAERRRESGRADAPAKQPGELASSDRAEAAGKEISALVKNGSGTLRFNYDDNIYQGSTTVSAGLQTGAGTVGKLMDGNGRGPTSGGRTAAGTELAQSATAAPEAMVPLRTELPKPLIVGTPTLIRVPNVEPGVPHYDYAARKGDKETESQSSPDRSKHDERVPEKIPLLGDLPVTGRLFAEARTAQAPQPDTSPTADDSRRDQELYVTGGKSRVAIQHEAVAAALPALTLPVGGRGDAQPVGTVVNGHGAVDLAGGTVADHFAYGPGAAPAEGPVRKDKLAEKKPGQDQVAVNKPGGEPLGLRDIDDDTTPASEAKPAAGQVVRGLAVDKWAADGTVALGTNASVPAAWGYANAASGSDLASPTKSAQSLKDIAHGRGGRAGGEGRDVVGDESSSESIKADDVLALGRLEESEKLRQVATLASSAREKSKPGPEEPKPTKPIFRAAGVNPWVAAQAQTFSTFSISVDSASFTLARRYLNGGQRPPPESVRTEEFVNFFDYALPPPGRDLFSVQAQAARTPFCPPGVQLLKLGVKGRLAGRENRGANLTFLLDTSGSMNAPDRLELARAALKLLVTKLGPADRVALVTFSSRARLVLDFTPATEQKQILAALAGLQAAGFTHLEGGLKLAYQTAARGFVSGAANRVILMSDGVVNVGADAAAELLAQVEQYRKQNIFCSVFGLGTGTYDDTMLQALASKGHGTYLFMDSLDEARRVFVDELAATLNKIAADVKIQVEFNPRRVKQYRQLGYEQRQLKTEDFRNDAIAAGEVGSGQSVTALYQVELQGDANEPVGTVRIRGRNLETGRVEELERAITAGDLAPSFERADVRFRLAAAAAEFAEILRGSPYAEGTSCADVAKVLRPIALELSLDQKVQELLRLVTAAHTAPPAAE